MRLGESYLEDEIAKDIRESMRLIIENNQELVIPTDIRVEFENSPQKRNSIAFERDGNRLHVKIDILGVIKGRILVTENCDRYELEKLNESSSMNYFVK